VTSKKKENAIKHKGSKILKFPSKQRTPKEKSRNNPKIDDREIMGKTIVFG
jgi:hypothetical protein